MFLCEDDTNNFVVKFLRSKGAVVISQALGTSQGDDISAVTPQGRKVRIEVKGDGYNRKWTQGQIYSRVTSGVFNQLRSLHASRRNGENDVVYGLAVPENELYRIYLNDDMMDLLLTQGMLVFFVRYDGTVELCGNDALLA